MKFKRNQSLCLIGRSSPILKSLDIFFNWAKSKSVLGVAQEPYTDWEWEDTGKRIGGPKLFRLPDGRFVVGGRLYGPTRTSLCLLDEAEATLTEVLTLPDEWLFLLDPAEIGEISGYHRSGELGGNWRPMKTSSRSWSDQGLHYYKGVAWYRQNVEIPAEYEGRALYLWFGGVDAKAHVWINGEFVGTSEEPEEGLPGVPGSFQPFDMPAAGAAAYGEENWVVVKIENHSLAELGTGGVLAPVMFWSPHDPDWKPGD